MEQGAISGRRKFLRQTVAVAAGLAFVPVGEPLLAKEQAGYLKNVDGLYTEPWMQTPGQDLASVFDADRLQDRLSAVIWGRRGCKTSLAVHRELLRDPETAEVLTNLCNVYQLNVAGKQNYEIPAYGVIDERTLAEIQYIRKTPTIIFFGHQYDCSTGIPLEIGRLAGRIKKDELLRELRSFS